MTFVNGSRQQPSDESHSRARGVRAEQVASWYFRLNGFLSIPGFVLHREGVPSGQWTEADLIAVRFPFSQESLSGGEMQDDVHLTKLAEGHRLLFVLVEVKTNLCQINGPWSKQEQGNMQRVIRRLGFARDGEVECIAGAMYQNLRWEGDEHVVQYVTVGQEKNEGKQREFPKLVQISWKEISAFLYNRFRQFPAKLPPGGRSISLSVSPGIDIFELRTPALASFLRCVLTALDRSVLGP